MKRKSVLLLLPLCLLTSCNEKIVFDNPDDEELIYLTRNGDNIGSLSNKLQDFPRSSNASELVSRISSGEAVFVYAYQFGCASCRKVEEAMTSFLRDSLATCYGLYDDADSRTAEKSVIKAAFDSLKSKFPAFKETIGDSYRTPTAYFIKDKETIINITFSGEKEDPIEFEKRFKEMVNYTSIYEFQTADAFLDFASKNDCFYLYDDKITTSGTFMNKVYSRAIHSQKMTARVHYSAFSQADKAKLAARLGNGSADNYGFVTGGIFANKQYKDHADTLASDLDAYYGKLPEEETSSATTSAEEASSEVTSSEATSSVNTSIEETSTN